MESNHIDLGDVSTGDGCEPQPGSTSLMADYVTVFKTMSPLYVGEGLSKQRCCRLLPLATCLQLFWVIIFMIVELSGGAGGTSGVAGTRAVLLFLLYIVLLFIALLISRAASYNALKNSNLVSQQCCRML